MPAPIRRQLTRIANTCLETLRDERDELDALAESVEALIRARPSEESEENFRAFLTALHKAMCQSDKIRSACIEACEEASASMKSRLEDASEKWLESDLGTTCVAFAEELESAVQNCGWDEVSSVDPALWSPGQTEIDVPGACVVDVEDIGRGEAEWLREAWTALDGLCDQIEAGPEAEA